jgi:hypothetical protein
LSVAKRHHFVPEFYLRGFSLDGRIVTVRLPGTRRFVQLVHSAGAETHYYTLAGHTSEPDVFEKALSEIEGQAAKVFEEIGRGRWPLSVQDRETLAAFITVQAVRGPAQRRNMQRIASQAARLEIGYGGRANVARWVKRRTGISISEEQADLMWDQATSPEGPPIRIPNVLHLNQIIRNSEALVKYVAGRPWTLVRFRRRSLVTCDNPVALIPHRDHQSWEGVGFMTAWGITYPLTRKIGLLMSDPMVLADRGVTIDQVLEGRFDRIEAGTTQLEKFFNESTVSSTIEWLYHHPADQSFLPEPLPEPSSLTDGITGGPTQFSAEPLFDPDKRT